MARTHLLTEKSVLLVAETDCITGEHDLVALTWIGRPSDEPTPWIVNSSTTGRLSLQHPALGSWTIECPGLPEMTREG